MPAVREFLQIVKETEYGVFNAAAGAADKAFILLPQDNAFTVRGKRPPKDIVSAGRRGQRVRREGRTVDVSGNLMTPLYWSQIPLWVQLLWSPTLGNCPDLASFSARHGFIMQDACTYNVTQYTGLKGPSTISGSDQDQNVMLSLSLVGSNYVDLPSGYTLPDADDVPELEESVGFQDTDELIFYGKDGDGDPIARKKYSSFELAFNDVFAPYRGEKPYLQENSWESRNPTLTLRNLYRSKQDRIDYQEQDENPASLAFNGPGGRKLKFDFGRCYMNEPTDDLKMAGKYEQTIVIDVFADPATGNDVVVTYTPTTP